MAKRGYLYHILLLTALGAYVFDVVQEGVELTTIAAAKKANLRKRQLMDERFLAVTKSTWPDCVNLKMSAEACKDFIDNEIYTLFTERDQYIRSVIIGKRLKTDQSYNAVTIMMNDNDMVEGRDGNGMVYYDFLWDGSGELATAEQQSQLTPIAAMEPTASLSPLGIDPESVETIPPSDPYLPDESTPTDDAVAVAADDVVTTDDDVVLEEPLVVFDEVITGVTGSTVDEFMTATPLPEEEGGGTTTAPIAGGVLTDGTAENTPEGDAKIEAALASLPPGGVTVEVAGERTIDPIDCAGLTGENCCLLIKLKIRDSDVNGNAIQCSLNYVASSTKKKYWQNLRGKKVHIFSNHNGIVSKTPQIVGDWPKGIVGVEFESWLLEGGSPPLILQ
ncbi:hypothetical protein QTG54_012865 [Skeletonema marinoi]|uniref:Uncharacterized protein n=1 Tax=Skeletonema marinoi TaxID=267567 RepID=A0AAD8XZK3_9STRA|nr:hypothetical protein QTG54_012865 [Skeletonema marinoi]